MRPGDRIANRFEIVARAGSGGMGTVYRGRDHAGGRDVAIKVLHPEVTRDAYRFDQEGRLLSEFDHPHIVEYVAHGMTMSGDHYMVVEWIEGQTLTSRLSGEGMVLQDSVAMMQRVADAVAYAHRREVVHRDIKPGNVLFPAGEVSRVKVIDFGIALRTRTSVRFTESGTVLGTPSYMAPEQAKASKAVDARSDVFSLGCVLYECLTGQVAFAGSNPLAVRAKALVCDPPPVRALQPQVPPALDDLVGRMLDKEPERRPRDAAEVAAELAALPPLPAGPPVRRATEDAATEMVRQSRRLEEASTESASPLTGVILAAVPDDYAHLSRPPSTDLEGVEPALEELVRPFGARVETLAGRSSMVVLSGGEESPLEQAARAARCALAIRESFPALALVLSLGDHEHLGRAVERGARTMEVAVRRAILDRGLDPGPASAGAIRMDPAAASMLGGEFVVSHPDPKTYYLLDGRKDP